MTNLALDLQREASAQPAFNPVEIAPVPRVTIHGFLETAETMAVMESAAADRRMSRAQVTLRSGGVSAAIEAYRKRPSPNLLILEVSVRHAGLLSELDVLASVCEPETRLVVFGCTDEVALYRDLVKRGVSEYLVLPVDMLTVIGVISQLYRQEGNKKLGHVYAFIGAKGGVGSSTIAHNVATTIANRFDANVMVADLDVAFGSADLNFNLVPGQGIAEAIKDNKRLDEMLLDRLLTPCRERLSVLTSPSVLGETCDFAEGTFEHMLEIAQAHVPFTVLDVPHVWTSWARKTLLAADEVVVTATPDLANVRNTKNLVALLKESRPNDPPPKLVLNQVGVRKRPEIKPADFAKAVDLEPTITLRFDPQVFGVAANNGQMICDVAAKSDFVSAFEHLARALSGKKEAKPKANGFSGFVKKLSTW